MKKQSSKNLYALLFYRLGLLLVLYTLCRFLFYIFNISTFPDISTSHLFTLFWAGLTFDISAMFYINIVYVVAQIIPLQSRYKVGYQKALKGLFCVSNSVFFFFNCADFAYFRYTMRRTTLSVFKEFGNDAGNFGLIGQLITDYWWIIAIWLVITLILVFAYGSVRLKKPVIYSSRGYYIKGTIVMLLIMVVTVIGMRGGLKDLPPININHATLKVNKSNESNIVLNTSFTLIRTSNQKSIKIQHFYSDEEVAKIYNPVYYPQPDSSFKAKNVFIIVLESFAKSSIGYYVKQIDSTYVGYTPFLDSLIQQSYGFNYSFSNGYASNDGICSIVASIPTLLAGNYVSSIYANNQINGIAELLSRKGYDCSFFHGALNGSMRFLEFSGQAGFQHYYGRTEYNNDADYDGAWGIWDEPFMQYTAKVVNTKQEPFMNLLFTLSSHPPCKVPEQYKGVFPEGPYTIHEVIGYTDNALRKFFNTVKEMPWYNNTLFVILADHAVATVYDEFKTSVGMMSIPIIFFDPSGEMQRGQNDSIVVQQVDVMPSILDYLNYDEPYFAFGSSVFSPKHNDFSISIQNGIYQFISGKYALQTNGDNVPVALYNYVDDVLLKDNLLEKNIPVPGKVDSLYKAVIQQYNNRLINNKTIVE